MRLLPVILKRQLASYFSTPATYFSISAFLTGNAALGFYSENFLDQRATDLHVFFKLHTWLYLFLIPFLATHLWSDERNENAIAFMNTLPVTAFELVAGKFFAAWLVSGLALLLTFPIVITINYLGTADNLVIASQYLGSWLLAGGYLSAGCFICVLTRHRLVIFTVTMGLLITASALSSVLDALDHHTPVWIIESLISLSPPARVSAIDNGLMTLHDMLYFASMIFAFLTATSVTLNFRKG